MSVSLIGTGVTLSGSGLAISLNGVAQDTYRLRYDSWKPLLSMVMDEHPSTQLMENYAYRKTAPYPQRWDRGVKRSTKGFGAVRWTVVNKDWSVGTAWHYNDRRDDLLRSLETDARMAGEHFATLDMRVRTQVQEGATDNDLLDAVPTAPDGAAWFSATDGGGGDRFGVSGGNILSGSGVANADQVRKDFFRCLSRWRRMTDTEGQPLLDPARFNGGFVFEYPSEMEQVVRETFIQSRTLGTITATGAQGAAASVIAAAAVTNVITESGFKVALFGNSYLTDTNNWYLHLVDAPHKSFFKQDREGLQERILTVDRGDAHAVLTKEERIFWDLAKGYGLNLPFPSLQVTT